FERIRVGPAAAAIGGGPAREGPTRRVAGGRPRGLRQDRGPAIGEGPRPPHPGGDPPGVPKVRGVGGPQTDTPLVPRGVPATPRPPPGLRDDVEEADLRHDLPDPHAPGLRRRLRLRQDRERLVLRGWLGTQGLPPPAQGTMAGVDPPRARGIHYLGALP